VVPGDFKGLKSLSEEGIFKDLFLVSQDAISTGHSHIHAIHWEGFLRQLWQDEIISQ